MQQEGATVLEGVLPGSPPAARCWAVHWKAEFLALCGFLSVLKVSVGMCVNNANATARDEIRVPLVLGETAHFTLDNTRV